MDVTSLFLCFPQVFWGTEKATFSCRMEEVNFELESLPFSQPETQKKQIWTASCTVSGRSDCDQM